eukprot:3409569-Rhodomonas_salina.1
MRGTDVGNGGASARRLGRAAAEGCALCEWPCERRSGREMEKGKGGSKEREEGRREKREKERGEGRGLEGRGGGGDKEGQGELHAVCEVVSGFRLCPKQSDAAIAAAGVGRLQLTWTRPGGAAAGAAPLL